ncbi:MAG TPA: thermonuclease family protein [Candidatus Limnocylindrales bacterium]|nr:thermonuclease family protein [Candidatus Limnocylindrales bacterium]
MSTLFTYAVEVVDVIDGDTVHLDIDVGFHTWRRGERYRLARINAPEMSTVGGPLSRAALAAKLEAAGTVIASTKKADAYGRYLVELIADGENLNDWMVANGWAVPYP